MQCIEILTDDPKPCWSRILQVKQSFEQPDPHFLSFHHPEFHYYRTYDDLITATDGNGTVVINRKAVHRGTVCGAQIFDKNSIILHFDAGVFPGNVRKRLKSHPSHTVNTIVDFTVFA